jgi:hypothetical protein
LVLYYCPSFRLAVRRRTSRKKRLASKKKRDGASGSTCSIPFLFAARFLWIKEQGERPDYEYISPVILSNRKIGEIPRAHGKSDRRTVIRNKQGSGNAVNKRTCKHEFLF